MTWTGVLLLTVLTASFAVDGLSVSDSELAATSDALRPDVARALPASEPVLAELLEPNEGSSLDYPMHSLRPRLKPTAFMKRNFRYLLRHRVGAPLPFKMNRWLQLLKMQSRNTSD